MSVSWIFVVAILIAVVGLGFVVSQLLRLRAGLSRDVPEATVVDPTAFGLSRTGPTIVHFTAEWCGPCVALRRVVEEVCAELPAVAHVEIDMDADPEAARQLSVLSLPTTFVFDSEGRQHYRASGVATAAELQGAVEPLLA